MAFFFLNSTTEQLAAFYPSPAGATESLLSLDAWNGIVEANPQLATLQPDVEAVLIRTEEAARADGSGPECFIVPIDVCYELVGEMRRVWRGFDGGTEAHVVLRAFFDRIRASLERGRGGAVSPLSFSVVDARAEPHAAVPTLMLRLRIDAATPEPVHAVALRCQIMIEPQRRRYEPNEEERLTELFGETPRWGDTLRPFLWTNVGMTIPGFTGWHGRRPPDHVHVRHGRRRGEVLPRPPPR